MIQFNFIDDVFNNLRSKIRRLGITSLWYRVLHSLIGLTIEDRTAKLNYLYEQTDIVTCPVERLYLWGQRLALPKKTGEDLEGYRTRLIALKSKTEGISVDVKLKIISRLSGIDVTQIRWKPIYPYVQNIGGAIGKIIASRDYALLVFRIYVTDNGTTHWAEISQELDKINQGGEICELWVETIGGSKTGIELGTTLNARAKNYEIY